MRGRVTKQVHQRNLTQASKALGMEYQAGGDLVGVPLLDVPLVHGGGAAGGIGGVFETGDELGQLCCRLFTFPPMFCCVLVRSLSS